MKQGVSPTIYGDGETSRDFTYVQNVVDGLLTTAHSTTPLGGEVLNLACGGRHTLDNLVTELNSLLGTSIEPNYEGFQPGDVKHSQAGTEKMKAMVGFEPKVSFREGLKKLI